MNDLRPGDVVARRKGPVMHKGVVMPDGRILHNSPGRGEHLSSFAEFSAGKRVRVIRGGHQAFGARVFSAAPRPGQRYNPFTNNCEHTVSRVTHGRSESPQLRSWVAGVGLAAVAFALTRHPGLTAAGFAMGRQAADRYLSRL
jgi:cell wall-associated NlpC family hydrolase